MSATAAPPMSPVAAPSAGAARRGASRLERWGAWALGFLALFNPYLIAGAEGAPRVSDLVGAGLAGLLVLRLLTGRSLSRAALARLLPVILLALVWMLRHVVQTGAAPPAMALRWLIAVPYAYVMWQLARDPGTRRALALGLFFGAVGNLGVVVMQRFGYEDLAISLRFASPAWQTRWAKVGGVVEVRPFGMWGHPNAASGVIALAFPAMAGLVDEGHVRARWIIAGLLVVFLGSAFTLTRSGMLVTALAFPLWALGRHGTQRQRMGRAAFLLALMLAAAAIGPPGGWDRWSDQRNLSSNSGERLHATIGSFVLALENPLGLGADYQQVLIAETGIPATHNAWAFLALVAGIPLTLLVLVRMVRHALSLGAHRTVEGWMAVQLLGIFLFEEFFRASVIVILAVWLVATPAATRLGARMRRPMPWRPPPFAPRAAPREAS